MFYDLFEQLCREKGVSPTQAGRENGIKQGTVSMWKKRGTTPKSETTQKLAKYFHVSPEYLLTGDESKKSPYYQYLNENKISPEVIKRMIEDANIESHLATLADAKKTIEVKAFLVEHLKEIMNSVGYDITRTDDGNYSFVGQSGGYPLSDKEANELIVQSMESIELVCKQFERNFIDDIFKGD